MAGQTAPASSPPEKPKVKSAFKIRKTQLHDLRHLQRIEKRHCRKEERISRYSRKKQNGRVRTFQYDFNKNKFTCENKPNNCGCSDSSKNCAPPFEIDEMDGIKILFKNVNPFLYSVNLYELQGDQISNENLTESNWSKTLTIDFDRLTNSSIERVGLAPQPNNFASLDILTQKNSLQTQLRSKQSLTEVDKIISSTDKNEILSLTKDKELEVGISSEQNLQTSLTQARNKYQNDSTARVKMEIDSKNLQTKIDSTSEVINKIDPIKSKEEIDKTKNELDKLNQRKKILTTDHLA